MISNEQPPYTFKDIETEYLDRQFRLARNEDQGMESRIRILEQLIVNLVPSGYGGGFQNGDILLYDIPATGYNIVPFDSVEPTVSRGVTFDSVTNTFVFEESGIWTFFLNLNIEGHDSSNAGRNFELVLYNLTDDVNAGSGVVVGVGRNQEDTFLSVAVMQEVSKTAIDDSIQFQFRVGNASVAIVGGTLIGAAIQVSYNSPLGVLL